MKNYMILPLLAGLMLLCAACEEFADVNEQYRPVGSEIIFSAANEYNNGVETKTEYSGQLSDVSLNGVTKPFERINWVNGDPIKVIYTRAGDTDEASYTVTRTSENNERDNASLAVTSGINPLYWLPGSGDHVFYAMYPNTGFKGNSTASLTNGNHVQGNIPSAQTITLKSGKTYTPAMEYAYMVARDVISPSSPDDKVTLHFMPAMTAFEFKFKVAEGDNPVNVTGFKMKSTTANLAGTFAFDITGGSSADRSITWSTPVAATSPSDWTDEVSVSFGTGGTGVQLTRDEYLDFTLFTLPVSISNVTITFTFAGGGTKSLQLKHDGSFVTFAPCKKYIITNESVPGNEVWTYYVEDIKDINTYGHLATPNLPFTVKSYRKSGSGTYEAVKWKVQYSVDGNSWSDTQPSGWQTHGAKFSITNTTGNGCSGPSAAGEANYANILRNHDDTVTNPKEKDTEGIDSEQAAIAVLRSRGTLPSTTSDAGDGYFDLSKHPIYPVSAIDGGETTMETANCYVITRPGKYKFPLVYGNAINENAPNHGSNNENVMAYAPQGLSASNDINYYLRRFVRHDDKPITDPWIKNNNITVADAVVVWQDVTDASMQIIRDGGTNLFVDGDYVKFTIDETSIRPGNIMIAARTSDHTIVWSWHIWVTEKDLSPQTVVDKTGISNDFMQYNLGWTDKVSGHGEHWVDWPFYIRIIQTDASGNILNSTNPQNVDNTGAADVFCVTQWGESISVQENIGSNCFYQWGRKDPLLPAASNNTNKRIYSAKYTLSDIVESNVKVKTVQDDAGTIGQSIRIPYNIFYSRAGLTAPGYNQWMENHMFIGVATNNNGGSIGTAWYGNLWDTGLIARRADYEATHPGKEANALNVNNRLPIKSVYDPSPRGYVVPYTFAFTSCSEAAWNSNVAAYPNPRNSLSADNEGYLFSDGAGGRFFLPFCGARGGDGVNPLYHVKATMYYWTTGKLPYDDKWGTQHKSKNLTFFKDGHTTSHAEVWAIYDQYSEGAYAIRPVLQVRWGASGETQPND